MPRGLKRRRPADLVEQPPSQQQQQVTDVAEILDHLVDRLTESKLSVVCSTLGNLTEGWPAGFVQRNRAEIGRQLAEFPQDHRLSRMLEMYDDIFFRGLLGRLIGLGMEARLCWNGRCTRIGARFTPMTRRVFKIEFSRRVLARVERTGVGSCGNVPCATGIEALQLMFEHELIHGLIFVCCPQAAECSQPLDSSQSTPFSLPTWTGEYQDESGHSRWFMSMLFNLFRQTDYEHQLCGDSPGLLL